jgi:hypothetical protein
MEEETLRKMAMEQYLQGKTPISIYQELGRTKPWFFKWLCRYRSGKPEWYRDEPKTPHAHPDETPPEMKKLVSNVRIQLEESYSQIGTSAIKWEFNKLGAIPPSDRTINRILRREGLVKKNSLYPQGGGIPLFHRAAGVQPYPSGRPHRAAIYQGRWAVLFVQCHRSLQPPSFSSSPTKKRRRHGGSGADQLLENHGNARLSSIRQRTLLPGEQSLPSLLWDRPQTLFVSGDRSDLYPDQRTLAERNRGELQ